jgi:YbgC/YbaW family acyl-CoA thioester hydrolase
VSEFTTSKIVRFGHVDPAGIAYFPRIYEFLHEAFEELWERHVGARYDRLILERRLGFPLVHSQVDFAGPLHFGDRALVRVTCFKLGHASLGLRYRFEVDGQERVHARMITACIDMDRLKSVPMPDEFRQAFERIRETHHTEGA